LADKLQFFIVCVPPTATAQEKKIRIINNKPHFYEPDDLKKTRRILTAYLAPHAPKEPFQGALKVIVKWCFPATDVHKSGMWKTSKPDTHNMNKLLFDIMTDLGFWKDDALVVSERIEKFYWTLPGIFIQIEEVENV